MSEKERTKKLALLGLVAVIFALGASPIALACNQQPPSSSTLTTYILCSTAASPGTLTYPTSKCTLTSGSTLPTGTTAVADAAVVGTSYGCDEWNLGGNCYGTVSFYLYQGTTSPGYCAPGTTLVYEDLNVKVGNNGVATSGTVTTGLSGSTNYYWYVVYSGTSHQKYQSDYSSTWFSSGWNSGSGWTWNSKSHSWIFGSGWGNKNDFGWTYSKANTCEPFTQTASTTTTTTSSSTGVVSPGTSVTDTAVVSSTYGTPTGTVQFYFCGPTISPTSCAISNSNKDGHPVSLTGGSATSKAEAPTATGYYCWSVVYTPSYKSEYLSSQSTIITNECFEVSKSTTITTTSSSIGSVSAGTSVTDKAVVTASSGTPTGTVQFYFCGPTGSPTSCDISSTNAVGSPVTLAGGSATSPSEAPTTAGYYCWSAVYAPSSTAYQGSQSAATTNECFQVKSGLPPTVPQFPLGMSLLLALAIPGLLLVRSKYASKPSSPSTNI